jgi:hypothetical protein
MYSPIDKKQLTKIMYDIVSHTNEDIFISNGKNSTKNKYEKIFSNIEEDTIININEDIFANINEEIL